MFILIKGMTSTSQWQKNILGERIEDARLWDHHAMLPCPPKNFVISNI
jgi:hypothetical protein